MTSRRDMVKVEEREVRKKYRELIKRQANDKEELIRPGSSSLSDMLSKGDELYKRVNTTREGALDSEFLARTAALGVERTLRLHAGTRAVEPDEFVTKLRAMLQGVDPRAASSGPQSSVRRGDGDDDEEEVVAAAAGQASRRSSVSAAAAAAAASSSSSLAGATDWASVGRLVISEGLLRRTPAMTVAYGPLYVTEKVKKVRQARAPREKHELVTPDEITGALNDSVAAATETGRRVQQLKHVLQKEAGPSNEPVDFFALTTHPTSFAQTVENVFHLAFLVNKGRASTQLTPDGRCVVANREPPRQDDYTSGAARRNQSIVALDMASWRRAAAAVLSNDNQQQPMVPNRAAVTTAEYLPSVSDASHAEALAEARREEEAVAAQQLSQQRVVKRKKRSSTQSSSPARKSPRKQ